MSETIGPVQILAVGFRAGAQFEGRCLLFEHVWARPLKRAIDETQGVPFAEGFLTPEAVTAVTA